MISFRLVTGLRIDLANPTIADVELVSIACGLSKICRFTGQLRHFYSVAQHAMMVAELVDRPLKFAALHHDDSEAFLNDLSRNLKHSDYLTGYRTLEAIWTSVIERALGIDGLEPWQRQHIKAADDLMAIFERVVMRERRTWDASYHVAESLADGFVGKPERHELIMQMAERIPPSWLFFRTFDPPEAERLFLDLHPHYRGMRHV